MLDAYIKFPMSLLQNATIVLYRRQRALGKALMMAMRVTMLIVDETKSAARE